MWKGRNRGHGLYICYTMSFRPFIILLTALLFPVCVYSQTNTEVKKGKIYLAGFNLGLSYYGAADGTYIGNKSMLGLFEMITQNQQIKEKFAFDINATKAFPRAFISVTENKMVGGSLGLVFKKSANNPRAFINHIETSIGLDALEQQASLELSGDSMSKDTILYEFDTYYSMYSGLIRLNLSFQLETPRIFGFLSFHAGAGAYLGKHIDMVGSTGYSILETSKHSTTKSIKYLYTASGTYDEPLLNAGFTMPLGIKMDISPLLALKVQWFYNINKIMGNSGWINSEYQGFNFLVCFKIKNNGERIRK